MLSIRFTRIGRKKAPLYRIVIMDKRRDPWGKYIEKLGFYNPRTKETQLDKERISYWLSQGAKCSATVHNLFVKNDLLKAEKVKSVEITKKRAEKINKAKEDKKAKEEAKKVESEKPVETSASSEEKIEEISVETSTEEVKEETPVVETPAEEVSKTE
ncbi:MAG: 30S ribosomal protein S16 [Patescibacteria group bacterium]|nr:30S ribosomal protein S16 [Patescibacteria group bacterium]